MSSKIEPASEMNHYRMEFDHLGLAVRDPEPAKRFLSRLGYRVGGIVCDPLQRVNLVLCRSTGHPDIEIVYPSGDKGPIDNLFRTGREGLYHLCYRSLDADLSVRLMREDALTVVCVLPRKAAVLFDGDLVSFYQVVGLGLIEIREHGVLEQSQT